MISNILFVDFCMYPSLQQRIIRGTWRTPTPEPAPTCTTTSTYTCTCTSIGRGTYLNYDKTKLEQAVLAVEQGKSYRRAAEMYGVPRSTLHDHFVGKIQPDSKCGPKPYLSIEEEEELVRFLDVHARIGYPYTRKHVLGIVQEVVNSKNIKTKVSNGWWESFLKRHLSLTLRTAVPLTLARAIATDQSMIECYFDKLEETLQVNGIFDKANNIFNCDETGFSLAPNAPKVVCTKGSKVVSHITGNTKSQITVLACTSAAGYTLPPFVIFDRKTLNPRLTIGEVPGTLYGLSNKGWIDKALFSDWFFNHFLIYAPSSRPLLLILDGHSSHYCPNVIRTASEHQVIIFALPPNTTHLTQPLDKGPFYPLKLAWKEVCHNYIIGKCITRYEFSQLFSQAWSKAMTIRNVISGFEITGICPFNRKAVRVLEDVSHQKFQPMDVVKKSNLAYHPLYSPKVTPKPPQVASEDSSSDSEYDDKNLDRCIVPFPQGKSIGAFFSKFTIPIHPSQLSEKPKCSGQVLTSIENLKILEEKQKKRHDELLKKEERKRKRERKVLGSDKKKVKSLGMYILYCISIMQIIRFKFL